jgi:RNA polymerase sigma-70 factor (ECF subfamily)
MTDHTRDTLRETTMLTMGGAGKFPTTRWTLVLAAGNREQAQSRAAMASLCESYWYPLYAYVRRRGYPIDQCQDLTQDFFVRLLSGHYVDRADPNKGQFRAFLLSSLKYFLADEWDRSRAQKRGGELATLPFEISDGEVLYQQEPVDDETPERIYERRWARTLLDRVLKRLRAEFAQHGRLDHFNRLKVYLLDQGEVPYVELAHQLETSEGALKVAIHRLRKRYRDLLRTEIADTVNEASQVDGELRFLAAALAGK